MQIKARLNYSRKLRRLNLGGNHLTKVPTQALRTLDMLKKLEMQENRIAAIQEGDFEGTSTFISVFSTILQLRPRQFPLAHYHCPKFQFLELHFPGLATFVKSSPCFSKSNDIKYNIWLYYNNIDYIITIFDIKQNFHSKFSHFFSTT